MRNIVDELAITFAYSPLCSSASRNPDTLKKAHSGYRHSVVIRGVLAVPLSSHLRDIIPRIYYHIHVLEKESSSSPIDRRYRRVDDRLTAVLTRLFNSIGESFNIDPDAFHRILFVHHIRQQRCEMKHDIDVGWQIIIENTRLNELDILREILGRPKRTAAHCDDIVIFD